MFISIQFHSTRQATHSYAGYNKYNNTSYMVVSEPMYEYVHTKFLRHMTSNLKGKSKKTIGRYDEMKT